MQRGIVEVNFISKETAQIKVRCPKCLKICSNLGTRIIQEYNMQIAGKVKYYTCRHCKTKFLVVFRKIQL